MAPKLKPRTIEADNSTSHAALPKDTKLSKNPDPPKSRLVPRGDRKRAMVGKEDDTLLRMLCDNPNTGVVRELHFRKIPHSTIDWNDPEHISSINSWRNQIYGRAGLKSKSVVMWHDIEELWFELYFHLSTAESRARCFILPKLQLVMDAFNATFVGQVLEMKDGTFTEPRIARQLNAFASKFNRVQPELKARLTQCVFGKSGDTFVPNIQFPMLDHYHAMKADMAAKGIHGESADSTNLGDWQYFFSHLPSGDDISILAATHAHEERVTKAKEEDAAVALMTLANSPPRADANLMSQDKTSRTEKTCEYDSSPTTSSMGVLTVAAPDHEYLLKTSKKRPLSVLSSVEDKENTSPERFQFLHQVYIFPSS